MFRRVHQDVFEDWELCGLFNFLMIWQFLKGTYSFTSIHQAVLQAIKLFVFYFKGPYKHVIFLLQIAFSTELKFILLVPDF